MSKYEPLRRYLQAAPQDDQQLGFAEIERVLGFELPPSARRHSAAWWSNEPGTHVQARAWIDAGWRVERVDRDAEKVYFGLIPAALAGVSDIGVPFVREEDAIVVQKESLRGSAVRLLEDYCEANGGTLADAVAAILNGMAMERRRQLIERFPLSGAPSGIDSTDLIREDRDAR